VFLWSSIVYQPLPLARALVAGKVWQKPVPLDRAQWENVTLDDGPKQQTEKQ
jgi:hypothetical protein